jgi:hypothetical protein
MKNDYRMEVGDIKKGLKKQSCRVSMLYADFKDAGK